MRQRIFRKNNIYAISLRNDIWRNVAKGTSYFYRRYNDNNLFDVMRRLKIRYKTKLLPL